MFACGILSQFGWFSSASTPRLAGRQSFSRDLCLQSLEWLIVEVFTAVARMEQALIAPVANHCNVLPDQTHSALKRP